jgi:hypothetical protein
MTKPDICPDCGEPVTPEGQAEFDERADAMFAALDDCDDPSMEFSLLVMAVARFLTGFDAKDRNMVRRDLFKQIDEDTKHLVIMACDA